MNGVDYNKASADGKMLAWRLAGIATDLDSTATLDAIHQLSMELVDEDPVSAEFAIMAALMETFATILPAFYRTADQAGVSPTLQQLFAAGGTVTDVFQNVIRDRLLTHQGPEGTGVITD